MGCAGVYCDNGSQDLEKHNLIVSKLLNSFPGAKITLVGDDGYSHLELCVVSDLFAGKSLIESHRMVLSVIREMIDSNMLHAISIKTVAK